MTNTQYYLAMLKAQINHIADDKAAGLTPTDGHIKSMLDVLEKLERELKR